MEKIKRSFRKAFLPSVIAAVVLTIIPALTVRLATAGNIIMFIALPPLYVGFYGFLFKRMDREKPSAASLFSFYRSAGKILKSFVTVKLGTVITEIFYALMALLFRNTTFYVVGDNTRVAVHLIITWIISIFFLCMPYLYAKNEDIGIGAAFKLSFKLGLKYMIIFIAINAVTTFPEFLYAVFVFDVRTDQMGFTYFLSLTDMGIGLWRTLRYFMNVLSTWMEFTAVYCIFERERDNMLKDFFNKFKKDIDTSDEITEDTPFIEPYDFCIEADKRFSDEKIIETENIRGVDILAALEEMDLAFDVVNHFGIRRKLKKMFDDLSFEISEFVTYEGGRSIENFFTEEIDEREFEVSVEISKASDYEPFKLILRVDISEEE